MIPKVSGFKQQYLFGPWIWIWAEFSMEQLNSAPLWGSWEAWKAGGCITWRPFAHICVVDAGCQLRPPQGLWLKHIHSLACGWVPRVNIPKGSESILTFITQPQKPHVTPTIVTSPHIFKGREQRPCLSKEECQHHIFRRRGWVILLVQPSLENTHATKYKTGKINLWS